jgi:hypothetical protein
VGRTVALVAVALAVSTSGGCSFVLVRPPPPRETWAARAADYDWSDPGCTWEDTVPIIDTVQAASAGIAAGFAFGSDVLEDDWPVVAGAALSALALAYAIGAGVGFSRVARCDEYLDEVWGPER